MTRRDLLLSAAGLLAAPASLKPNVCLFSKHIQFLDGEPLARAVRDLGFPGLDITVRPGGHIEPARVATDLPRLVAILRQNGVEVPMVTAGIVDADTPHAEAILKTIAELGIRHYRWGGFRYDTEKPIAPQIGGLKPRVARLAALNARYKVCAMYHTHSGIGQMGAAIWDLHILLQDFDPNAVAVNYDIGHATIEGGFGGWIHSLRLLGPRLRGVAVKDFLWEKNAQGVWRPAWKPLGQGMVQFPRFFKMLADLGFSGPLQVHYEYPLGGADTGRKTLTMPQDEVFSAVKRDYRQLQTWLREAGLA